jgi:hypothetical protein
MKQYLFSIILLIAGIFLAILGINQFDSKSYYSDTTFLSGIFEHLEEEKIRYSVRYDLKLKDDNRHYRIIGITSSAFDVERFQNKVNRGELVELQIKAAGADDVHEITGISSGGVNYFDLENRNSKRRRNGGAAIIAGLIFMGSALWEIKKKTKHNKK